MSCYTAIELQPRCHPSFLMGTGDHGAALLPWQQALSHSPHIAWSMHVVPSKLEHATAETGLLSPGQGYLPPALIPNALLIPPPTLRLPSILLMHSLSPRLLTLLPDILLYTSYILAAIAIVHSGAAARGL